MEKIVNIGGIELLVEYEYYKGETGTWEYPGSAPFVEVSGIYLEGNDQDIYDVLKDYYITQIEDKLIEMHNG
jgi:hypothetical protein